MIRLMFAGSRYMWSPPSLRSRSQCSLPTCRTWRPATIPLSVAATGALAPDGRTSVLRDTRISPVGRVQGLGLPDGCLL